MTDSPLKLVVFDCDGTLVDSQHNIIQCMELAFHTNGLPKPSPHDVRGIIGLNLDQAIFELLPVKDDRGLWSRVVSTYKQAFFEQRQLPDHEEPLYEGAKEALDYFYERDILMAVATGKSMRGLNAVVERHGLEKYFTSLQTPDHNPGKPHPQMIYAAMEAVGAEKEHTFMVGDTSFDMQLGKNAGCTAIGVNWGYHDTEFLKQNGADYIISHFNELFPLISD